VVEEIRKLILAWPHPTMTWEAVRSAVNTKFKAEWTRQALSNHGRILKAFQATKERLRKERDASPNRRKTLTRDSTVPVLQDRIRFLEDRTQELEREILEYKTQFLRIQQNAYLLGVSMPKLLKSTEPGDRGRSDR
jgi:predicted RNase H-like nuclease (RuvC/YqgF family)